MNDILDDTLKVADENKKTNKLLRTMKTVEHDEKLQKIIMRLNLLANHATFLFLVRFYNLWVNCLFAKINKFKDVFAYNLCKFYFTILY